MRVKEETRKLTFQPHIRGRGGPPVSLQAWCSPIFPTRKMRYWPEESRKKKQLFPTSRPTRKRKRNGVDPVGLSRLPSTESDLAARDLRQSTSEIRPSFLLLIASSILGPFISVGSQDNVKQHVRATT
ncbi:unnamed protein product [Linum tenue]|uniref:Uncharacterized protein n=1 Tax=Linum tenue TaxID=586396 RepID=A0AAV0HWW3_9ROSI|nr:unnamed protein product [Linum tenue]